MLFMMLSAMLLLGGGCSSHRKDMTKVSVSTKNRLPDKKVKIMEIKDNECVEVTSKPEFIFEFVDMAPMS